MRQTSSQKQTRSSCVHQNSLHPNSLRMSRSSRGSCVAITPSSQGPAGIREWGAGDHIQKSLVSSRNLLSYALPPGERLNSFSLVEEKLALQNATFKELGVYTILLDVFDGELLFPLLGDPFKAEPKPEDVPKLSLILDPNKSKVAPSKNRITNIIESSVRVVEAHEQTRVGH